MQAQSSLFIFSHDALIEGFVNQLENAQIRTVGPELVFGKIYDAIERGVGIIQLSREWLDMTW